MQGSSVLRTNECKHNMTCLHLGRLSTALSTIRSAISISMAGVSTTTIPASTTAVRHRVGEIGILVHRNSVHGLSLVHILTLPTSDLV